MKIALAQLAPLWLDKHGTIRIIIEAVQKAAKESSDLIIFGEAFLPGYPHWLSFTNATNFDSPFQKKLFAHYSNNSIDVSIGELSTICKSAEMNNIAIYLGFIERAKDRGGHSLYCSLAYINKAGVICSIQRKLMPTYDERLVWSIGDGNGLRVHNLEEFCVGGLNCWENWMPLARQSLYAQGENLHIAVWPGSKRNTHDITTFIAKEARSYVASVSTILYKKNFSDLIPFLTDLIEASPDLLTNGGSCVASPDGSWLLEPQTGEENIYYALLDIDKVQEERQNFDPSGHYSRPDVLKLTINRKKQSIIKINDTE